MKQNTIDRIRRFTIDRDWDQFHSPANLAKSISIEANELLECFQWNEDNYDLNDVKEEFLYDLHNSEKKKLSGEIEIIIIRDGKPYLINMKEGLLGIQI